jgi:hypothetical protein
MGTTLSSVGPDWQLTDLKAWATETASLPGEADPHRLNTHGGSKETTRRGAT